jgi:hypothetical protein
MLDMDCIAQSNEDILRITFETKIFFMTFEKLLVLGTV